MFFGQLKGIIDPEEVGPPGVQGFSKKKKIMPTQPLAL
jgi:hypothetical protein